ncbi:MAG: hypothetical protein ACUVXI_16305 [bacterium]
MYTILEVRNRRSTSVVISITYKHLEIDGVWLNDNLFYSRILGKEVCRSYGDKPNLAIIEASPRTKEILRKIESQEPIEAK